MCAKVGTHVDWPGKMPGQVRVQYSRPQNYAAAATWGRIPAEVQEIDYATGRMPQHAAARGVGTASLPSKLSGLCFIWWPQQKICVLASYAIAQVSDDIMCLMFGLLDIHCLPPPGILLLPKGPGQSVNDFAPIYTAM